MKITDSPGAISVMPFSAINPVPFESSSICQPAMLTGVAPLFVNSNQSAAYGALPLAHGVTSVMKMDDEAGGSSLTMSVSVSV